MGGAIAPMALAWVIRRRMETPLADSRFSLPDAREITARLIGGSAIFGIGWGIAGLCPGPAIADLAIRPTLAAPFVIAMLAGFAEIGRAHVCTPATNANIVCRVL